MGGPRDTSISKSGVLGDFMLISGVLGGFSSLTLPVDSLSGWQRVSSIRSSGGDGGGVGAVSGSALLLLPFLAVASGTE